MVFSSGFRCMFNGQLVTTVLISIG